MMIAPHFDHSLALIIASIMLLVLVEAIVYHCRLFYLSHAASRELLYLLPAWPLKAFIEYSTRLLLVTEGRYLFNAICLQRRI